MKNRVILLSLIAIIGCGPNQAEIEAKVSAMLEKKMDSLSNVNNNQNKPQQVTERSSTYDESLQKETAEFQWNYSGKIDKYPIKAQINYGESYHLEGTGAIQIPITGYYYYESKKIKIPLKGTANGVGLIYLIAQTENDSESFDGEFSNGIAMDFRGTWHRNNKVLNFYLTARQ